MACTMLAAGNLDIWLINNIGETAFDLLKSSHGYVVVGAALSAWWHYEPGDVDIIFEEQHELRGFIHYLTEQTAYRLKKTDTVKPSKAREAIMSADGLSKLDLLYYRRGVYDFAGTIDLSCCRVWYCPGTRQWFYHSPMVGHDIATGVVQALQQDKTTPERVAKYAERAKWLTG